MTDQKPTLTILQEAESTNVEFKSSSEGRLPKDIWHTIGAFANTDGGKIVFGVAPDGTNLHLNRAELDKLQLDMVSLCKDFFNVIITPEMVCRDDVLIVDIPPTTAALRPVFAKTLGMNKGTYVRIGSSNHLANEDWLRRFSVASRGGAETLSYGHDYTECLDVILISQFIVTLNARNDNIYQDFTPEEVLIKQKAITPKGEVTLFGLLAFGKDMTPQEIIAPTVKIGVTQYPGSSKVDENDLSKTYIDNKEFGGNVLTQFDRAFSFIKSKLPISGTIDNTGKRRDYLVIPEVAIREALANAIAHRDYSSYASLIQVDIYANRLEIINPGQSLVPIDQLDSAPSATRNPLLMNYLKEYGITDQKARGIRTIKIALQKAGLLEPRFENVSQSFKITLFASAFISPQDRQWLGRFDSFDLNIRQRTALAHIHNNTDGISNGEYRDINSMTNVRDDKKANAELSHMVELGILQPVGDNKARRYIITPQFSK